MSRASYEETYQLITKVYRKLSNQANDPNVDLRHLVLQAKMLNHLRSQLRLLENNR